MQVPKNPNDAGPRRKTSDVISAVFTWKFNPKSDIAPMTTVTSVRSLRPLTYRIPSTILRDSPAFGGTSINSFEFIMTSAIIIKRKAEPFKRKEGPVPKRVMRYPESAGPINLPKLKFAELRLTAFGKSSTPTISETKLCLTGPSTAAAMPVAIANKKTCQIFA